MKTAVKSSILLVFVARIAVAGTADLLTIDWYGVIGDLVLSSNEIIVGLSGSPNNADSVVQDLTYRFPQFAHEVGSVKLNSTQFSFVIEDTVDIEEFLGVLSKNDGVDFAARKGYDEWAGEVYLSNQYFVRLHAQNCAESVIEYLDAMGYEIDRLRFLDSSWMAAKLNQGTYRTPASVIGALRQIPCIESVTPAYIVPLTRFYNPDDPLWDDEQDYLHEDALNLENAFDYNLSDDTVRICILDNGVAGHEDWPVVGGPSGYDFTQLDDEFEVNIDYGWHAMAVTGVIWAAIDNSKGPAGFNNENFEIAVHQIFAQDDPYGPVFASETRIIAAIDSAVGWGADIINYSWGKDSIYCGTPYWNVYFAISQAHSHGVLNVAAPGNCNGPQGCPCVHFPANHPDVFAVGGMDVYDDRHESSSYGAELDALAYYNVYTLVFEETRSSSYRSPCAPSGYDCPGGTSFSSPQAVGIAGLVLARRPDLKGQPDLLANILRYSTDDGGTPCAVDTAYIDQEYGWGRLDARRALLAVSRGDVNNNAIIDIADVTYLVAFNRNGPPPLPELMVGDCNCDCSVDIADLTYLVAYCFNGGPAPQLCYRFPD